MPSYFGSYAKAGESSGASLVEASIGVSVEEGVAIELRMRPSEGRARRPRGERGSAFSILH
jgi:hypothetical protein